MSIFIFFLVLFLLILVHELGHFWAAKYFKIRVDEFGLGFPPKLFGKKWGETEYTFNLLPIGGFVRIFGEDPDDDNTNGPDRDRSFVHKPWWQQAIVLVAGVTMNVLLAWVLFVGGFMFGMPTAVTPDEVDEVKNVRLLVVQVLPDSPAAQAGIQPSDQIVAVSAGGVEDTKLTPESVSARIAAAPQGEGSVELTLKRGKETVVTEVTPQTGVLEDDQERAVVGIQMSLAGSKQYPLHEALWEGTKMTWNMLGAVVVGILSFFGQIFTFQADFEQVTGPVGIVGMVGDASSLGFAYLVTFTAFISLNLAVINMLPFPALDGGRLMFVFWEAITKRPVPPKIVNTLNRVGFALLILLMIVVTYNDVVKLF